MVLFYFIIMNMTFLAKTQKTVVFILNGTAFERNNRFMR